MRRSVIKPYSCDERWDVTSTEQRGGGGWGGHAREWRSRPLHSLLFASPNCTLSHMSVKGSSDGIAAVKSTAW